MEKYIKDGKVAILYSPGWGSGWYTWNDKYPQAIFCPNIVEKLLKKEEIDEEFAIKALRLKKDEHFYMGGLDDLEICWLPVGTMFTITEFDGYEEVETIESVMEFIA